jgi:transposase InsO family protein
MHPEAREELRVRFKKVVLDIAAHVGVTKTCHEFGVARSTFYEWKTRYDREGVKGLYKKKPVPLSSPRRTNSEVIGKVVELRTDYKMGSKTVVYYLDRYHGISVSESTVTRIFNAHGLNRLAPSAKKRVAHSKRYAKTVPGHRIQVDVKVLSMRELGRKTGKRFQYTAVDDATRIRALKIYTRHTQANAVDFVDHVVERFPFRIHTIQTDRGHEFQSQFHWHVEDAGIDHVYIKARSPELNGKVERFHRTDQKEFYQLLSYTDDVDLNLKLQAWEDFYNYDRPHFSHQGKTPYEMMRLLQKNEVKVSGRS